MALNFSEGETLHLIELYRSNESLYDRDHYEYGSRVMRRAIIADIADKLHKSPATIMAKIECLRTQFALSLKKQRVAASKREGGPQPKEWRFFRALHFLEPHMSKQNQNQGQDFQRTSEDYQENGEQEVHNNQTYETEHQQEMMVETQELQEDYEGEPEYQERLMVRLPKRRARKRKHRQEPPHEEQQLLVSAPPNPPLMDADCKAFGDLVAAELQVMGPAQRLVMKRQIMSIVYGYTICDFKVDDNVLD